MVPQSGCSGLGALTSENQAGHRVAAPVLLHIGEVAGPRQQATEHGSAAQACGAEGVGARDTATTTRPAFRSGMATPRERSLRCASAETWSAPDARLRVGQGTPTGRILPSSPLGSALREVAREEQEWNLRPVQARVPCSEGPQGRKRVAGKDSAGSTPEAPWAQRAAR